MRSKLKVQIVCLVVLLLSILLIGCTKQNTPEDLIKQKYGNTEYTITFNSEDLEKPIKPIKYTLNRIPELPTPAKIGYVFLGWFFDKGYRDSYSDQMLLLKASDVVLYPKWTKEEFIEDGKYNVDFKSTIVEDSIKKGEKTDKYGYWDFSNYITKVNTYIEKRGNKKILRLSYDGINTVGFARPSPFELSVSSSNPGIAMVEKNENLSTSKKDIFLDITNHNLSKPIYLTVVATNYHTPNLSDDERKLTETTYDVAFQIEKINGLGEAYVDTRNGLADGHYLAKSFYRQINNKVTMMSLFNPVYGYIVAENGQYKYVKEVNPYYGLVGPTSNLLKPLNRNFYHRGTTFANFYSAYTIDFDPDRPRANEKGGVIESDYHPRGYNAGRTIEYSLEYDSKTNRMWQVFNLGDRLDKHLVAVGAPTGFMEIVGHQGLVSSLITIDYKTMIRVPAEYKPIKGDSYVFQKQGYYYPGSNIDFSLTEYAYEKQKEIGTTNDLPNFFYGAKTPIDKVGNIKSFRMTTTGSGRTIRDSKGMLESVTAKYEIFDFDVSKEHLIGDMMETQLYTSTGWRNQRKNMPNGKMLPFGSGVNIKTLFGEKVTDADVEYTVKAYRYSATTQAYTDEINAIDNFFTFNENLNLKFTFKMNGYVKTAQVQLREYVEPEFHLNATAEDNFDPSKTYHAGDKYSLPKEAYATWGDTYIKYMGDWYGDAKHKVMINNMYMAKYQKKKGVRGFESLDLTIYKDIAIEQKVEEEIWVYYIQNQFGEVKRFEYVLKTEKNPTYTITNNAGDKVFEKTSTKDNEGNIKPERTELTFDVSSEAEFKSYGNDTFKYNVGTESGTFEIYRYYLITSETNEEDYVSGRPASVVFDEIYEKLKIRGGIVHVEYVSGKESLDIYFVLSGTYGDKAELKPTYYRTLFTGQKYLLGEKFIKDMDGNIIAKNFVDIYYKRNGETIFNNGQYFRTEELQPPYKYVTFLQPGNYMFVYKFFANNLLFIKKVEMEVKSNLGEVEVKYITDSQHPFKDGTTERTITHSLRNEFYFLDEKYFDTNGDRLLSYMEKTLEFTKVKGKLYKVRDFIKEFNSDKIEIKVTWDKGSKVTLNLDKAKTGFDNIECDTVYKSSNKDKRYYFNNKIIDIEEIIKHKAKGIEEEYVLVGVRSTYFNGGYISIEEYRKEVHWRSELHSLELELVFKKRLKLKYEIDDTYTKDYYKHGDIVEDLAFGEHNNKIPKLKPEYESTHKFVGWYIKGDTTQTIIDFKTYIARMSEADDKGIITIVAKFEAI